MAAHLTLLFITSSLLPLLTSSQPTGKITLGASICANDTSPPWLSPSKEFAFGFQPLSKNNNNSSYVLSIWFDKIPPKTIVWFDRYTAPLGATLTLEAKNGLVLRDSRGNPLHTYTENLAGQVAYGAITDSGNLILSGNAATHYWESFKNPADTILPGQTIESGGSTLVSRKSPTELSYGRFYTGINADGKFALTTKTLPTNLNVDAEYYTAGPGSSERVAFAANPPEITIGSTVILRSSLPAADYYFRATIDFDGVFSLYQYPKKFDGNSKWEISSGGTLPENVCLAITGDKGSGACGYNNVCSLKDGRPACRCPDGFVLVDQENEYGDCRANFSGDCLGQAGLDEYRLVTIKDVDWPLNDYVQMNRSTLEECRDGCLKDYLCGAAIFRSNSCWRKRLPLSNGRVDTSLGAVAFLKVRK
ncbi:S-locus lectin protein kinase family protein [Striga asiatica]|uniref:S-locus lectin protein kinase family protein n=1 Tax=Striga asiatica TaxID=4170 RepID=A0A5A7NXP0_STRAF|nr:S-locus lectin protein kinase family protein [Striga asiatica]